MEERAPTRRVDVGGGCAPDRDQRRRRNGGEYSPVGPVPGEDGPAGGHRERVARVGGPDPIDVLGPMGGRGPRSVHTMVDRPTHSDSPDVGIRGSPYAEQVAGSVAGLRDKASVLSLDDHTTVADRIDRRTRSPPHG